MSSQNSLDFAPQKGNILESRSTGSILAYTNLLRSNNTGAKCLLCAYFRSFNSTHVFQLNFSHYVSRVCTGADPGFSNRGGGGGGGAGAKARSSLRLRSSASLRKLLGFKCSLMPTEAVILMHSDTKWNPKRKNTSLSKVFREVRFAPPPGSATCVC